MKEKKNNNNLKDFNKIIKYMGIAFEMIAIIGAGTYFGFWLDKRFNNQTPYLTITLSLFAVVASTYLIIKQILNDK